MKARSRGWLLAAWAAFALAGCDNQERQLKLRPLDPSDRFADGSSARPWPAHTVAHRPVPADAAVLTGERNGQPVSEIPVAISRGLLIRGRERFEIYCSVCHGLDGYGSGVIVRRGFPAPPSFHDDRLRQAPAGHFLQVIQRGFGLMYPYGDRVPPEDGWAIIAYIRALQRSQHGSLADVPPNVRTQPERPR